MIIHVHGTGRILHEMASSDLWLPTVQVSELSSPDADEESAARARYLLETEARPTPTVWVTHLVDERTLSAANGPFDQILIVPPATIEAPRLCELLLTAQSEVTVWKPPRTLTTHTAAKAILARSTLQTLSGDFARTFAVQTSIAAYLLSCAAEAIHDPVQPATAILDEGQDVVEMRSSRARVRIAPASGATFQVDVSPWPRTYHLGSLMSRESLPAVSRGALSTSGFAANYLRLLARFDDLP